MVHQVWPAILARHLLEVDAVGAGGVGDLLRRPVSPMKVGPKLVT
jgi:hypothetical protein